MYFIVSVMRIEHYYCQGTGRDLFGWIHSKSKLNPQKGPVKFKGESAGVAEESGG